MKKIIVSILAVLYLSTSIGATLHMHYCMGKLISWSLENIADHTKCSKCSMEKKNACCGDKKIFIKAEKDQKRTQTDIEFSNSVSEIDNHNARFPEIKVAVGAFIHPSISAHPIINTIPLFILNRVFRL